VTIFEIIKFQPQNHAGASTVEILLPECTKTRTRASWMSKNFPGCGGEGVELGGIGGKGE